jgi:type 2 lantibiotic biosynthesis protein LanM
MKNQNLLSDKFSFSFDEVIPLTQPEMVEQAIAIATNLQKQSIRLEDNSCSWLMPLYNFETKQFQFNPMQENLYDGTCGVALFLAALGSITKDDRFSNLALNAIAPMHLALSTNPSTFLSGMKLVGGAVGYGAIIYSLVTIAKFLTQPDLIDDAKQVALSLDREQINRDRELDVILGSAGALLGILSLYEHTQEQVILDKAIDCGNYLVNNRVTSETGFKTWAIRGDKLLTGFSHGAAGIAYALLRLYRVTHESAFLEAATEAISYERSVFIPQQGNWPDFRRSFIRGNPLCETNWCNGAPGIGLARVGGLDLLDTAEIRQDIEVAIETTVRYGLCDLDHLCCGNFGRIEFLFTAARKLNSPQLLKIVMTQVAKIVANSQHKGHFGYNFGLAFDPSFFQGASGIGYQILRLAYPDLLPSVLLWE